LIALRIWILSIKVTKKLQKIESFHFYDIYSKGGIVKKQLNRLTFELNYRLLKCALIVEKYNLEIQNYYQMVASINMPNFLLLESRHVKYLFTMRFENVSGKSPMKWLAIPKETKVTCKITFLYLSLMKTSN
jgi:hypothetical protein